MASRFELAHRDQLQGTLTTVDRLIIHGHLSRLWFPNHMAYLLDRLGIHIVRDFGHFVKQASSRVVAHAEGLAKKAGRPFIYQDRVVKGKDELARQIAARDGVTDGLVCVFSTVEPAMCFALAGGAIRPRLRKCLHLYFYVLDRELGFIHIRLQTWFPFHILGVTGRAILKALIDGETNPERLADLARGRLKAKRSRLIEALQGWVTPHHTMLLKLHLDLIEAIEAAVDNLDREIGDALAPFRNAAQKVKTVPGISDLAAQGVIAEIGVDMSRFLTHRHLLSWACLCPRLDQSAGKIHSTRTRKGALWLKTLLIQCAWAAVQGKNSYLRSQFYRIRARRGPKTAIGAVAASMLTAIYYILRDDVEYRDLGPHYLDTIDRTRLSRRLVRRLENMGYHVELSGAA